MRPARELICSELSKKIQGLVNDGFYICIDQFFLRWPNHFRESIKAIIF